MFRLTLILLTLICYFGAAFNPPALAESPKTETTSFSPVSAYFVSPSTPNSNRRFIAVGNFLDTTNNAYFADSIGYLNFEINLNKNQLQPTAVLKLYKYANAYSSDVKISASSGQNPVGSQLANNSEYDYQPLIFDLGNLKSAGNNPVSIRITAEQDQLNYGIAICSGNVVDSVCPTKYHPQIEVSYISNSIGELILRDNSTSPKLNSFMQSQNANCIVKNGCTLDFDLEYRDIERNTSFLKISDKVSQNTLLETEITEERRKYAVKLADGEYSLDFSLLDGEIQSSMFQLNYVVDTSPPDAVKVLYKPEFGSRQGAEFQLDYEPGAELIGEICTAGEGERLDLGGNCQQPLVISSVSQSHFMSLKSPIPLINEVIYKYVFTVKDQAGNLSSPLQVELKQLNQLGIFTSVELSEKRISPRNQDNRFDLAAIKFETLEPFSSFYFDAFNSSGDFVAKKEATDFNGQIDSSWLADGVYYLRANAVSIIDGYNFSPSQAQKIHIDNTPPRLVL